MDNVKRIEELLNMYLKQNKDIRDKYQNNLVYLQLYEELFSYLELSYVEIKENSLLISILFNTIYGNNIYGDRFYSLLLKAMVSKEGRIELKHFINMIKKDYDNLMMENDGLVQQIERNKNVVSSANRVKLCFKYGNIISGDLPDVSNVKRIISLFQLSGVISNKEELLLTYLLISTYYCTPEDHGLSGLRQTHTVRYTDHIRYTYSGLQQMLHSLSNELPLS